MTTTRGKRPFAAGPGTPFPHATIGRVTRKVRKANVLVLDLITNALDNGVGANVQTTTLFRCGQVVSDTGAPAAEFVNDACTMVRFIFQGGVMSAAPVDVTISIAACFIVVARVEAGNNMVTRFRDIDNQLLMTAFSDSENIFYSRIVNVSTPQTSSANRDEVPILIDMKAKRKLNTGDSIVMFTYTTNRAGSPNQDVFVSGVSTVIAI